MNEKLRAYGLAAAIVAIVLACFTRLVSSNYSLPSMIGAAVYLLPLLAVVLIMVSPVWVGLLLGFLTVTYSAPILILARLQIRVLVTISLCGLMLVNRAIRKERTGIPLTFDSLCMTAASLIVLGRILHDRPGSAQLSDVGGAGEAFIFMVGLISYFMVTRIVAERWDVRKNLKVAIVTVSLVAIVNNIVRFSSGSLYGLFGLFDEELWLLCPIAFAIVLQKQKNGIRRLTKPIPYWIAVTLILALGVVSPHRSRPFFALGIIAVVSYAYGRMRKTVSFAVGSLVIAVGLLLAAGSGRLPLLITRSLSTVVNVSHEDIGRCVQEYGISNESGWRSGFRVELYRVAWAKIRKHPFTGNGFTFTQDDIIRAFRASGAVKDAAAALALAGGYHNSLLELAVFCGLPAAFFISCACVFRFRKFLFLAKTAENPDFKVMATGISGFFVTVSGQMLMNGRSQIFFCVCVIMGFMRGMCIRGEHEPKPENAAARRSDL